MLRSTATNAVFAQCVVKGKFTNVDLTGTSLEDADITNLHLLSSTVDESEKVRDHITASQLQRRSDLEKLINEDDDSPALSGDSGETTQLSGWDYSDSGMEL